MPNKVILKLKEIFIPCQSNDFKPRILKSKFLWYYLLVLLVLKIGIVLLLINLPKNIFFADISQTVLMQLVNQERKDLGIEPLKESSQLNQAAFLKAQDMLAKNYFSHQNPQGMSPWEWLERTGYDYQAAGENLGIGFLESEEIYQAWSDSPSHKANLLNPKYGDTGVAVVQGYFKGNKTTVVVQFFGSAKKGIELLFAPPTASAQEPPEAAELTESSEATSKAVSAGVLPEKGVKFRLLRFMAKDYNNLLQKIILYSILLVCLALLVNVLSMPEIQDKKLIMRTIKLLSLLVVLVLLNKDIILRLIPHNLGIQ